MVPIGTLKTKHAKEIAGSLLGIGFECLDRGMWTDSDPVYRYAGELGIKHARLQSGWARTETRPGIYDFSWLDRSVGKLRENGIAPWLSLSYGNPLYLESPAPDATGCHPLVSETARRAWLDYVAVTVRHFRGQVSSYEIWNEPDNGGFWYPPPCDLRLYAELVRITSAVIRREDPSALVIGGALTHALDSSGFQTVKQLLDAGLAEWIDALSYHHYSTVIERQKPEMLQRLRECFARYGKPAMKFIQGEGGFPSRTGTTQALAGTPASERIQAEMLLRYAVNDLAMNVSISSYFQISDFRCYRLRGVCGEPNHFGVMTFDDPPRRKESYFALQRLAALFSSETRLEPFAAVELYPCDAEWEQRQYRFPVDALGCPVVCFKRNGVPLISYHRVFDVAGARPECEFINLDGWMEDASFEHPVVIDPMDGVVYGALEFSRREGRFRFKNIPMKSYPLFLTDLAAADMESHKEA